LLRRSRVQQELETSGRGRIGLPNKNRVLVDVGEL
jgi:hypothetical protein